MSKWIESIRLESELVTLKPLEEHHRDGLLQAASDGQLWELWYTSVPSAHSIDRYIESAIKKMENNQELAFIVKDNRSGKIIGSTRYCRIDALNQRLEIGYTWYAKSFQRSLVNTQVKLLLLQHAFESLKVIAVEFRTHWCNQASRNAILRLGAKQDGVLRNHQKMIDGSFRDTVVFSIIESEWPTIKQHLHYKLGKTVGQI